MKILIDVNLPESWVAFLMEQGHEAVYWASVGPADALDAELMKFAAEGNFVLLTHDLDFGILHALSGSERPSLIQVRLDDITPALIGARVAMAIVNYIPQLEHGCILTIATERIRSTTLPLPRLR